MERWILSNKVGHRLLQHLLFWLVHLLVFSMLYSGETFWERIKHTSINIPFQMASVYTMLYLLFPALLITKRYIWFAMATLLCLSITTLADYGISMLIWEEMMEGGFVWRVWFSSFVVMGYTTALALGLKLLKFWNRRERYIQELSNARLAAELKFLKAQIHPHFLFNTMNNLYALSIKQSSNVPEVIEKLSALLRYMAYEKESFVALEDEIEQLKNYLSLEKLRYGTNLELSFILSGQVDQVKIAPLLLLPFVENCFKHGISGNLGQSWITISIEVKAEQLLFKVENSKAPAAEDKTGYTHGIGLKNVRRRLELIYKEKYELKIIDTETYLVVLKIDLS